MVSPCENEKEEKNQHDKSLIRLPRQYLEIF